MPVDEGSSSGGARVFDRRDDSVADVAAPLGSQQAYERLRAAIVGGRLQPNERLVEADLIRMLRASRSSVRTALVRLVQEGLVEHEPNRGAKVRLVEEQEAAEILESRMVLEGLAARYAARNASEDEVAELKAILERMRSLLDAGDLVGASDLNATLHARLLEIAGHRTVSRLVAMLSSQLVRFQYRTILVPGRAEKSHAEHRAIVDAVARRDPEAAEAAVREHLAHVVEALRSSRSQPAWNPSPLVAADRSDEG
jgi:DNA-binding GntR family transcriptional regulator